MRFSPVVSAILLAAYLPACTSYQATTQPLAALTASPEPPERVRVTTNTGERFIVDAPRVVHDSLFGTTMAVDSRGTLTTRAVAMPLSELHAVEVRKSDGNSTMILVVGIVAAGVLLGVAGANAMDDWGDDWTIDVSD